jgi:hypothetical protein
MDKNLTCAISCLGGIAAHDRSIIAQAAVAWLLWAPSSRMFHNQLSAQLRRGGDVLQPNELVSARAAAQQALLQAPHAIVQE